MGLRSWLPAGAGAASAALAAGLFAGYLWVRPDALGDAATLRLAELPLPVPLDEVVVAGLLAAALGLVARWRSWRRYRRVLRRIRDRVALLRQNPSPHALHGLAGPA